MYMYHHDCQIRPGVNPTYVLRLTMVVRTSTYNRNILNIAQKLVVAVIMNTEDQPVIVKLVDTAMQVTQGAHESDCIKTLIVI